MKKAMIFSLLIIIFGSCKKSSTLDFNTSDAAKPAVPVTVSNLFAMTNAVPTVQTSLSGGGAITITLQIPGSSGRTIKQITKVAVAANTTSYSVVQNLTAAYNAAPIAGSGTSVTFTTTLAEYTAKTGLAVTTSGTATSFLARYFYFLITLDNGEQLIAVPVRVYVNS
jgi:hypothetical protein